MAEAARAASSSCRRRVQAHTASLLHGHGDARSAEDEHGAAHGPSAMASFVKTYDADVHISFGASKAGKQIEMAHAAAPGFRNCEYFIETPTARSPPGLLDIMGGAKQPAESRPTRAARRDVPISTYSSIIDLHRFKLRNLPAPLTDDMHPYPRDTRPDRHVRTVVVGGGGSKPSKGCTCSPTSPTFPRVPPPHLLPAPATPGVDRRRARRAPLEPRLLSYASARGGSPTWREPGGRGGVRRRRARCCPPPPPRAAPGPPPPRRRARRARPSASEEEEGRKGGGGRRVVGPRRGRRRRRRRRRRPWDGCGRCGGGGGGRGSRRVRTTSRRPAALPQRDERDGVGRRLCGRAELSAAQARSSWQRLLMWMAGLTLTHYLYLTLPLPGAAATAHGWRARCPRGRARATRASSPGGTAAAEEVRPPSAPPPSALSLSPQLPSALALLDEMGGTPTLTPHLSPTPSPSPPRHARHRGGLSPRGAHLTLTLTLH